MGLGAALPVGFFINNPISFILAGLLLLVKLLQASSSNTIVYLTEELPILVILCLGINAATVLAVVLPVN